MKFKRTYVHPLIGGILSIPAVAAFLLIWLPTFNIEQSKPFILQISIVLAMIAFPVFVVVLSRTRFTGVPFPQVLGIVSERVICYCLGFTIINYGLAKVFKTQFYFSLSTADTVLRELPPTVLTWYYFGQSYPFSLLIAASQIVGGLLLLFRRTSLLGAVVLLPVIVNIAALNYFYDLWPTTKILSALFLMMDIFIISRYYKILLPVFLPRNSPGSVTSTKPPSILKPVLIALLITMYSWRLYHAAEPYQLVTPLQGSYKTTVHQRNAAPVNILNLENIFWKKLYLDKAYHGSIRRSDDALQPIKYELGPGDSIKITFNDSSYDKFSGTYKKEGTYLTIKGRYNDVPVEYIFEEF